MLLGIGLLQEPRAMRVLNIQNSLGYFSKDVLSHLWSDIGKPPPRRCAKMTIYSQIASPFFLLDPWSTMKSGSEGFVHIAQRTVPKAPTHSPTLNLISN